MGYYIRVFCRSERVPTVSAVSAALRSAAPSLRIASNDAESQTWKNVELHYKDGKEPILVEINSNDGPDSLAAEEAGEFEDEVASAGQSDVTRRIVEQLRANRFTVCCQLISDIDDDGFAANDHLIDYFVASHSGMVHADGEGFYEGSDLILELK